MSDIKLGDYRTKPVNLENDVIEAVNVKECSETSGSGCNKFPCKNHGECQPLIQDQDYFCQCPEGFG